MRLFEQRFRWSKHWLRVLLGVLWLVVYAPVPAAAVDPREPKALMAQGQYHEALVAFQHLAAEAEQQHDTNTAVFCLISLATCQQSLGLYCEGLENLERAHRLASGTTNFPALKLRSEAALGNAYAATRRYGEGERLLRASLETATQLKDEPARLAILQNLGNLLAVRPAEMNAGTVENGRGSTLVYVPARVRTQAPLQEALQCYDQALALAQGAAEPATMIRLRLNKARAQLKAGTLPAAAATAQQTLPLLKALPDSGEKAFLQVAAARCLCDVGAGATDHSARCTASALELLEQARQLADAVQDRRTASFAWGYLADLHQGRQEFETALFCAEQALFRAQQFGEDDARFHWQWLVGSLFREQGQRERAITWYRQAAQTLQSRRGDFYTGLSLRGFGTTFHASLGEVYYQLADLLLQKAADPATPAESAKALTLEARQTIEMLKTVELESYFLGDDCTSLLRKQTRLVDQVSPGTAVVYFIPLPNRTEILLSLEDGLRRITSPATTTQIATEARRLRTALENPATAGWLESAQQLWAWLLQPLEPVLKAHGVKTLVFIPDATLRGVPMAALHGPQHYLVEEYALAVSPGLSLLGAERPAGGRAQVLRCGLSKPVQGHAELKYVPAELQEIGGLFKGPVLLDEQFRVAALQQALAAEDASIVHIASHAHFGGDAQQSYILAFDERLTLEGLETLIEPRLLSPTPIELLTLSACQTAAGDERSALGLAGVAIKSGARSTLATLWSVNDESTQRLMATFYQGLKTQSKAAKAEALQKAQRHLLQDPRFQHPFFWSPYILIGDWN